MNVNKAAKIFCIICAVLMLAVLILQYLPSYWTAGEDSSSIADYVWWPHHHKDITKEFRNIFGRDYEVQQMVLMPVTVLIATILGIVVCILSPGKIGAFIIPLIDGAMGLYGFLTVPVFSLGSTYIVQIIACALLVATAVVGSVFAILNSRKNNA